MPATPNPERAGHSLEIACFDATSLLLADQAGAHRTEFCADRSTGGVSPALDDVRRILPRVRAPVRVMIRPRGGAFVYSDVEFECMKREIRALKAMAVGIPSPGGKLDGFVFGVLDPSHRIDVARNSELVALAAPFSCTLHRAFDETADLDVALEDAIACGFETILTSGGAPDAAAGLAALSRLVARAGPRITIMLGGGVRSGNVGLLVKETKAIWYHSSAIVGNEVSTREILALKEIIKDVNSRAF